MGQGVKRGILKQGRRTKVVILFLGRGGIPSLEKQGKEETTTHKKGLGGIQRKKGPKKRFISAAGGGSEKNWWPGGGEKTILPEKIVPHEVKRERRKGDAAQGRRLCELFLPKGGARTRGAAKQTEKPRKQS